MDEIRVTKAIEHRPGQFRARLIINGKRSWGPIGDSAKQAEKLAHRIVVELTRARQPSIDELIGQYRQYLIEKGNKAASFDNTPLRLRRFFAPILSETVAVLTESRCESLYMRLRAQISERTGKPLSVDTHRAYLADARTFGGWLVKTKRMLRNPLVTVEGLGRRSAGKPQLRHDEGRRLSLLCLQLAPTDDGAVATLLAMLMGLRASEIVTRTVRDLDRGGSVLWVDSVGEWSPKTAASRRSVEIPVMMQPLLWERARDKEPTALLFPSNKGRRHDRGWVRKEVARLCSLADVPLVCAHSLRGFQATTAIRAGASPHLVAVALGHERVSITLSNYIDRGALDSANQQRAVAALLPSDLVANQPIQTEAR